jgi:hypothetical protein
VPRQESVVLPVAVLEGIERTIQKRAVVETLSIPTTKWSKEQHNKEEEKKKKKKRG